MKPQVLIVDDDEDLRETLRLVLEAEGYGVETAENGRAALERLYDGAAGCWVVLLDLLMPVMNGWQTLAALERRPPNADVRVVVSTSAPGEAPPGRTVLPKPVDLDELLSMVARLGRCP
jgi:CheY-like chemotaxis protein